MSEDAEILLVIWFFWLTVTGLDLVALMRLRRLALPPTAAVLWTVWIVIAPLVGAASSFIVAQANRRTA